jgi:hypothetical protein
MILENQSRNKSILIPIFGILLLVGIAYLAYNKFTPKYEDKGYVDVNSTSTDKTNTPPAEEVKVFTDEAKGVTFKYPTLSSLEYISALDWPPKVEVQNAPYTCTQAGKETERAGETKSQIINGRTYCVTKLVEGAAGSMYIQYAYEFEKYAKPVILTFSLRFSQCANYEEDTMKKCESERQAFNVDEVIDNIAQTFVLSK